MNANKLRLVLWLNFAVVAIAIGQLIGQVTPPQNAMAAPTQAQP
jgi:hypothetical protein